MKKHLNNTINALHKALGELSADLYDTYHAQFDYGSVEQAPEVQKTLAMARTAAEMESVIQDVWAYDRKGLRTLLANPNYEPIHMVVREVLAVKEQAALKHRERRAAEEVAAFKLEARFHLKEQLHG